MTIATAKFVSVTHDLHLATDAESFCARFNRRCETTPIALVEAYIPKELILAVVVGGSIPLQIATGASDVDLMVVTAEAPGVLQDGDLATDFTTHTLFRGAYGGAAGNLSRSNVVCALADVEIDIDFLALPQLQDLITAAKASGASLTSDQVRILSRFKSGWLLYGTEEAAQVIESLARDNSLELRSSVTNMRNAIKAFGHAKVAIDDDLNLARYLGRASVEWTYMAILSALGCAYPGEKWLRVLNNELAQTLGSSRYKASLHNSGIDLLFPPKHESAVEVKAYLDAVAKWINEARRFIEEDPAFRFANRFCKQIYDVS
tara:strand:+ start:425 stop:1381 length:957 start_codon:yes stop_codon:yes gene_type:complete